MCERGLQSQCETTQVTEQGTGAALFGYTELYGRVPGGQAQYLRVPQANGTHIKVPDGPPDERFVYLSDVVELGGTVTGKEVDPEGEHLVHVTTFARNQRGDDVMPGKVTVALPSREGGPTPVARRARAS